MKRQRASFSVEYAILIAIVVAGLVGMSVYLKRSISGKWREVGDTFGQGRQYEPPTPLPPACIPEGSPCPEPGQPDKKCCDGLLCKNFSPYSPDKKCLNIWN